MEKTDKELVGEAQNGSLLAFEQLVKRHQRSIFHFIHRWIREDADIEDIAQETFIALYKNLNSVDPNRALTTYICEIAKNKAFSHLRKNSHVVPLTNDEATFDEENWFDTLTHEYNTNQLQKTLSKLKPQYKTVLTLYYFKDLSYEQISHKLKLPLNTVRTLLRRAKLALKKEL